MKPLTATPPTLRLRAQVAVACGCAIALSATPVGAAGASVAGAGAATKVAAPDARWPFRSATRKNEAPKGGVGLVLEVKADRVVVGQPVPGGPAQRAGLHSGDLLATVDDWTIPPGTKVPDVADHIRGVPGTRCRVGIERPGEAAGVLTFELERAPMDRMFPQTAKDLVRLRKGGALLATGALGNYGFRLDDDPRPGEAVRYSWALAPFDKTLADATVAGTGLVVVEAAGAVVQIGDWRTEWKPAPDQGLFVATSNLPVSDPGALDWTAAVPPYANPVRPRASSPKKSTRWEGSARLTVRAEVDGKPLARHRLTLTLANEANVAQDTRTVVTDPNGVATFEVPVGTYGVTGLPASMAGAERDASFAGELAPAVQALKLVAGTAGAVTVLPLARRAQPTVAVETKPWTQEPRVGHGLPPLDVLRWHHGLAAEPKSLAGTVLLLYVWATWCGPCWATSPLVAELHARLKDKGVVVVEASIDRDEAALDEFVAQNSLAGAPPVAYVGPDAMEALDIDSVPTLFVVDGTGTVRALVRGSGWGLDAMEGFVVGLVAAQKAAVGRAVR